MDVPWCVPDWFGPTKTGALAPALEFGEGRRFMVVCVATGALPATQKLTKDSTLVILFDTHQLKKIDR